MDIEFEILTGEDHQVKALYDLLARRDYAISHRQMPSFAQHSDFVRSHPYLAWYLVKVDGTYAGSVYVTDQNTIGVNVLDEFVSVTLPLIIETIEANFAPLPAIKSKRSGFFSINVAPSNTRLIEALNRQACQLIQMTYLIPQRDQT